MRAPTLLIAAAAALLTSGGAALACSCVPFSSAAEHLAASDLAFKGRVLGSQSTGPDTVRFLPPLTVSDEEVDEALRRLRAVI